MAKTTNYKKFNGPTQTILLHAEPDIDGHADAFIACWPDMFLYCPAFGWLYWTGSHWEQKGAQGALQDAIVQTLYLRRHIAVDNQREALLKASKITRSSKLAIKEHLMHRLEIDAGEFDNEPHMLNCQNGAVDLRTGTLYKHYGKTHRFTYCLGIDYDPSVDTNIIEKHYRDDLGNPDEMVPFLKRAFGYSLTGNTREEKVFYCPGPARAGKDTGIGAFREMLGAPLAREVNFDTLTEKRYGDTNRADIATLKPARFVLASESDRQRQMNAATVKNLSGGNEQFVAFKRRDHFSYTPQFKMWLISNWSVNVDVEDAAAWGRIIVVEFPNGRLGKEDPKRKESTRSKTFKKALLAWSVEGAQEWYSDGLQIPDCAELVKKEQHAKLDSLAGFCDDCLKADKVLRIPNPSMYATYLDWCRENGYSIRKHRAFTQGMKRLGHKIEKVYDPITRKTTRCWLELTLK